MPYSPMVLIIFVRILLGSIWYVLVYPDFLYKLKKKKKNGKLMGGIEA
jgi:hypothetical protein